VPSPEMEYVLATSSPSQLATYRLEPDRLVIAHETREDVVPFSAITAIQLQHTLGAFIATIRRRTGRQVMIRSRCVLPGMKVEDRVAAYGELLRALHAACLPHRSTITFLGGSTAKYWLSWALLLISPCLLVLAAFAVADGLRRLWILFVIGLGGIAAGLAGLKQGRGKPYDPERPPPTLLPPAE